MADSTGIPVVKKRMRTIRRPSLTSSLRPLSKRPDLVADTKFDDASQCEFGESPGVEKPESTLWIRRMEQEIGKIDSRIRFVEGKEREIRREIRLTARGCRNLGEMKARTAQLNKQLAEIGPMLAVLQARRAKTISRKTHMIIFTRLDPATKQTVTSKDKSCERRPSSPRIHQALRELLERNGQGGGGQGGTAPMRQVWDKVLWSNEVVMSALSMAPACLDDSCSMCLEPLVVEKTGVTQLDCGHSFHTPCFLDFLVHNSRGSGRRGLNLRRVKCPLCRKALANETRANASRGSSGSASASGSGSGSQSSGSARPRLIDPPESYQTWQAPQRDSPHPFAPARTPPRRVDSPLLLPVEGFSNLSDEDIFAMSVNIVFDESDRNA